MYSTIAITALVLSVINLLLLGGIIYGLSKAFKAVKPMTQLLTNPPVFDRMGDVKVIPRE